MQTIVIKNNIEVGINDLVQRLAQLDESELASFFASLNEKINDYPQVQRFSEETLLLHKIKNIVPASVVRQYKSLRKKAHQQTISEKEKQELLLVSDFIEEKTAEKINMLAELAKIRKVSFNEILQQFTVQSLA